MTNEERAKQALPVMPTGNGWDFWDYNEEKRKGYLQALSDFDNLPAIEGFIVKNKYGEVSFFSVLPERNEEFGGWFVYGACINVNFGWKFKDDEFKDLRWEDEPIPYKLILSKK